MAAVGAGDGVQSVLPRCKNWAGLDVFPDKEKTSPGHLAMSAYVHYVLLCIYAFVPVGAVSCLG